MIFGRFDWLLTKFGRGRAAKSFKLDLVEVLDKMLRLGTYGRWSLSGILIGWMNMLWSRTTLSGLCLGFGMLMHIWSNKDKEVQSSFTLFWGKDVYNRNQQLQFWKGWTHWVDDTRSCLCESSSFDIIHCDWWGGERYINSFSISFHLCHQMNG